MFLSTFNQENILFWNVCPESYLTKHKLFNQISLGYLDIIGTPIQSFIHLFTVIYPLFHSFIHIFSQFVSQLIYIDNRVDVFI